eukprot:5381981-Pyramimonas_sp.AAC.1
MRWPPPSPRSSPSGVKYKRFERLSSDAFSIALRTSWTPGACSPGNTRRDRTAKPPGSSGAAWP